MPLTLVTGRAHAGKTGVLYSRLLEALAIGAMPVVLVPTASDAARVAAEFAGRDVIGIRVAVLDALIEELWSLHGDGRRIVDGASRTSMLGLCVDAQGGDLPAAGTAGFLALMEEIVRRMAGQPLPVEGDETTRALMRITREYFARLEESGLLEQGQAAFFMAEFPPELSGPVAVNRFTDLSPPQERLLQGLSTINDISLALVWERGFPATECLDALVERLMATAAEHHHVTTPVGLEGELAVLERDLYRPTVSLKPGGAVQLGEAAGPEAEVALVVNLVAEEIEAGTPPERVAVAFRALGARAPQLAEGFASRNIEAEIELSCDFGVSAFGRAFLALLDSCSSPEATRERLLAFVSSPYSGIVPEVAADLDVRMRRERLFGRAMMRLAHKRDPEGVIAYALEASAASDTTHAIESWARVARTMLRNAHRARGLSGVAGQLDGAALTRLMRMLQELGAADGAVISTATLRTALNQARIAVRSPEREGAVRVTEAHNIRSRRFDVIILGGMSAAEFSSERPEPLAAELLRTLGLPAGTEERLSERLLFYSVVTRARERLYLVRQSTDARGEPLRASVFVDEVLDLYREAHHSEEDRAPLPVIRLGMEDLHEIVPVLTADRRELRRGAKGRMRPPRGVLHDSGAIRELAERDEYSVSELETYLACPYRWFLTSAVGSRSVDAEFGAGERGTFAHGILATFYRRWRELTGLARLDPQHLTQALELIDEVADEAVRSLPTPLVGIAEELSMGRALQWVRAVISDDATLLPEFEIFDHEYAFGKRAGRPVTIAGVPLRGRIDRIDRSEGGILVTDYKSSSSVHGWRSFETYGLLQIVVYADAGAQLLGEPLLGGVYRSLRSLVCRGFYEECAVDLGARGSDRDAMEQGEIDALLDATRSRLAFAAKSMREGRIPVEPSTRHACTYCSVRLLCERGVA